MPPRNRRRHPAPPSQVTDFSVRKVVAGGRFLKKGVFPPNLFSICLTSNGAVLSHNANDPCAGRLKVGLPLPGVRGDCLYRLLTLILGQSHAMIAAFTCCETPLSPMAAKLPGEGYFGVTEKARENLLRKTRCQKEEGEYTS